MWHSGSQKRLFEATSRRSTSYTLKIGRSRYLPQLSQSVSNRPSARRLTKDWSSDHTGCVHIGYLVHAIHFRFAEKVVGSYQLSRTSTFTDKTTIFGMRKEGQRVEEGEGGEGGGKGQARKG